MFRAGPATKSLLQGTAAQRPKVGGEGGLGRLGRACSG